MASYAVLHVSLRMYIQKIFYNDKTAEHCRYCFLVYMASPKRSHCLWENRQQCDQSLGTKNNCAIGNA